MAKKLKVKVRQFLGLSPKFVEVTEEKLVGGGGGLFGGPPPPPPILTRVKIETSAQVFSC